MDDGRIVEMYFERKENAIAETAKKYGRFLRDMAGRILQSPEDVEECVNDVYHDAWQSIPPNRPHSLAAYLGSIARRRAIDLYRKNTSEKRGNGEAALILSELEECLPSRSDVEKEAESKETLKLINAFLKTLSKDSRNIFLCRYWYAYSVTDIAKRFGFKEAKVTSSLFRTRQRLHDYLESEGK